jgi:hypothetical protein
MIVNKQERVCEPKKLLSQKMIFFFSILVHDAAGGARSAMQKASQPAATPVVVFGKALQSTGQLKSCFRVGFHSFSLSMWHQVWSVPHTSVFQIPRHC